MLMVTTMACTAINNKPQITAFFRYGHSISVGLIICTATEQCVAALILLNKGFLHSSSKDQEVI